MSPQSPGGALRSLPDSRRSKRGVDKGVKTPPANWEPWSRGSCPPAYPSGGTPRQTEGPGWSRALEVSVSLQAEVRAAREHERQERSRCSGDSLGQSHVLPPSHTRGTRVLHGLLRS